MQSAPRSPRPAWRSSSWRRSWRCGSRSIRPACGGLRSRCSAAHAAFRLPLMQLSVFRSRWIRFRIARRGQSVLRPAVGLQVATHLVLPRGKGIGRPDRCGGPGEGCGVAHADDALVRELHQGIARLTGRQLCRINRNREQGRAGVGMTRIHRHRKPPATIDLVRRPAAATGNTVRQEAYLAYAPGGRVQVGILQRFCFTELGRPREGEGHGGTSFEMFCSRLSGGQLTTVTGSLAARAWSATTRTSCPMRTRWSSGMWVLVLRNPGETSTSVTANVCSSNPSETTFPRSVPPSVTTLRPTTSSKGTTVPYAAPTQAA